MHLLLVLFILFAVFFLLSLITLALAVKEKKWLKGAGKTVQCLLLLAMTGFFAMTALGIRGYEAFTREEAVARMSIHPAGEERFTVLFEFPDGAVKTFELLGDELYVDAHVLKWTPVGNLLGLHTLYELDRVSGRYRSLEEERRKPRTVYALSERQGIDLFDVRRRCSFLKWFVDAQYGSATFVPAGVEEELVLWISTSGLLIRPAEER